MSHPVITGLMAYGMSGKVFHAPFLSANAGFTLHAVVERSKKIAETDYSGIISYSSINEMLEDIAIELVIVNTPNYLHFEHAKAALLAGKHVLVEKPFTATVAEALELFELGKVRNLKVMVYQNRRYSSDFLATKKILESGKLGNVMEAHFRFDRYRREIGPKAFKETPFPASGIMYDLGAHLLDQVISLYGVPNNFTKTTGIYRQKGTVPDYGHIQLDYGKWQVFVTVSQLVADPQSAIVIHGDSGSFIKSFSDRQEEQSLAGMNPMDVDFGLEAPDMEGCLTIVAKDGTKKKELVPAEKGNMMGIFDAVYGTVRHDTTFPVTEEQILIQLDILAASDNF